MEDYASFSMLLRQPVYIPLNKNRYIRVNALNEDIVSISFVDSKDNILEIPDGITAHTEDYETLPIENESFVFPYNKTRIELRKDGLLFLQLNNTRRYDIKFNKSQFW